ncbi:MAG: class I tRNA ligase family protein, partial [Candidatus Hermodarchaeota archaeon]
SVFLRFPLKNRKNEFLLVWTTTPWTLTSNVSAAVHPDLEYAKVKAGDEIFYISQTLTAIIDHRDEVLDTLYGEDMAGWEYEGPFDELPALEGVKHKVILWDEVSAAEGTGIVHIAPGCGAEDFELGKEHDLPAIAPLDESGYFLPEFGEFAGTHVNESAKRVFDSLIKKSLLYKTAMYTHRYPICWRCKDELVFRLTDEWFISCEEIRPRMIREVRKVKWFPDYGGKRMEDWLRNMGDWCISRKRYWGLPLPIYECECGETTFIGTKKELEERAIEGLESLELAKHEGMQDLTLHRPWIDDVKIACPKCEKSVSRITDVGDCWLDAGIISFSTLNYLHDKEYWEAWYPADWISEMMEQVKLWFYSMLFMSVTLTDQTPYKAVLVYEKLFDEKGRPMHKSTGNAIWFDDAVEKLGADVMRWVYCSANIRANLLFGFSLGEEITRKLLTLWNIYFFFFSNAELDEFNPKKAKEIPVSQRPLIDRWLLSKTQVLIKESREALDVYDVRSVVQKCEHFMDELSNIYIRQNRRRFWGSSDRSDALAGYLTLYDALETFTRLLAPIIPFTSEYFYQRLVYVVDPKAPISVHLCDYPEPNTKLLDEDLMGRFDAAQEIIYLGRSIRSKKDIIGRQPLQKILIWSASPKNIGLIKQFEAEILNELNVKGLEYVDDVKDLVEYEITPNFALVGPKYKQEVGFITQALKEYNPIEAVKHVAESRPVSLDVNGRKIELPPEEIIVKSNEKEGLAVMGEGDYVVALETTLTEELIQEGLARTVVRYIQDLRKKKDFNVTDKISVYFKTSDETISKAIETFKDYISKEILATTFETFDKAPKNLPIDELAIQKKPFLLKIQRHTS